MVILDMRSVSGFCAFFVIAGGTSLRQVNAIARGVEEELGLEGVKPLVQVSPNDESGWVVVDFDSVVVHVFHKPMREFYALERLWSDAKRVRITRRKSSGKAVRR